MVILTKFGIKFSITIQGAAAFEKAAVRIGEKYPKKITFHLLEKSDICDAYILIHFPFPIVLYDCRSLCAMHITTSEIPNLLIHLII